jgi:hypothetical protein
MFVCELEETDDGGESIDDGTGSFGGFTAS